MTENKALIPLLVTMMLVTGVCNTILNKYQDMQCVRNCDSPDEHERKLFEQPVLQTAQMFVGEMGCWLVVLASHLYTRFAKRRSAAPLLAGGYRPIRSDEADNNDDEEEEDDEQAIFESSGAENPATKPLIESSTGPVHLRGWRVFLLAAPACCDITGTTLMNVGLLFVAASIYQMTRGALVLFVGLFSVLFLRRKLYLYQWLALVVVVLGVALVGLAGALFGGSQGHDPEDGVNAARMLVRDTLATTQTPEGVAVLIGVLLIAAAQIFTASQFVLEEWILENYAMAPLNVVGWEGVFGFSVTVIGMIILHLTVGSTEAGRYGYFDMAEGWREITTNKAIAVSSILIMISIGGFNFFGLSVTRTVSATSRSTIDTCRTLFIWLVSLALGWENFKWLQVAGFALLVYGTFLFNDIVRPPLKALLPTREAVEAHEELLPEEPIEHS